MPESSDYDGHSATLYKIPKIEARIKETSKYMSCSSLLNIVQDMYDKKINMKHHA